MLLIVILLLFFAVIFIISSCRFYKLLRQLLLVQNTPTSMIRSASQGYVELYGTLVKHETKTMSISPYGKEECVWFHSTIEQSSTPVRSVGADYFRYEPINWFFKTFFRIDPKWKLLEESRSVNDILLDDGSGLCYIDPEDAKIIADQKVWYSSDGYHRYTEKYLYEGDILYAIGYLQNRAATENITVELLQTEIIRGWKQDYHQLKARFHLESDVPTLEEWEKIRLIAQEQAEKRLKKVSQEASHNYLRKPPVNNLPFILANKHEEDLINWIKSPLYASIIICLGTALIMLYIILSFVV